MGGGKDDEERGGQADGLRVEQQQQQQRGQRDGGKAKGSFILTVFAAPDGGSKKTEGGQLAPADQHYLLCVTASQDFHEKQRSVGMHG